MKYLIINQETGQIVFSTHVPADGPVVEVYDLLNAMRCQFFNPYVYEKNEWEFIEVIGLKMPQIIAEAARRYGKTPAQVLRRTKKWEAVAIRAEIVKEAYHKHGLGISEIARGMGLHHSTIIYILRVQKRFS